MHDIAIIGGGFSGSILLAHLVRHNPAARIALIDDAPHVPCGAAYSTPHDEHLLNVPAIRMGAFADDAAGFHLWCTAQGLPYAPDAYVPRRIYGAYLSEIHRHTLAHAQALTVIPQRAVAGASTSAMHTITLADGTTLDAARIVLATGNYFPTPASNPWRTDFAALTDTEHEKPIVIIGTGLTAVDVLVSLRTHRVRTPIRFISRRGHFPAVHVPLGQSYALTPDIFLGLPLSRALHVLRQHIKKAATEGISWHAVIDALRPHTPTLWAALTLPEKQRFLRHLKHTWDIHRHRMAESIHAIVEASINDGQAHVLRARITDISPEALGASLVFDCRGPSARASVHPLLAAMIAQKSITASPTGIGLMAHSPYRVSAPSLAPIYAMGPLLAGEWLESTAVPELRQHASALALLLEAGAE